MEAVPRLPMLSFPRKENTEKSSFTGLKQYIGECYGENPDSYSKEIYELEMLRNKAVRASEDLDGLAVMKRYICQIHSIGNRFPLGDENPVLSFSWREIHSPTVWQSSSLRYEICVMLYNVAALHMQLGSEESRTSPESMKVACTHFQCAGWIFGYIRETYPASMRHELTGELLTLMQNIAFGQAQECILEKSLADNRKAVTVAKVTAQIVSYYNSAMAVLLTTVDGESVSDVVGGKTFKSWKRFVKFKILYLSAILYLYQGQSSEDAGRQKDDPNQTKWAGECVTLYKAADEKIKEALKESKGIENIEIVTEALTFTIEVITAKYENAVKDNDFIYHAPKPELKDLSAVQGANLVNGISFSFTDSELMGDDIFHRLVPMKAHESSSVYSEEKANILRKIAAKIEQKDDELASFMSSLNVDTINNYQITALQSDKLPQTLVDRCAALNAKPNAIPDLVQSMSSLAETWVEVEGMLKEIKNQLGEEEKQEEFYQKTMGHRAPGGHMQELTREFQKYLEAHNKAGESNDTLRKAMGLHVQNLKILSQPLSDIRKAVPVLSPETDEAALRDLQVLFQKVDEMKAQRDQLLHQLRESINSDDITSKVIAWGDKKIEKLFEQELAKHEKIVALLEQNMNAQGNILKAVTDTYARCANVIKTINETKIRREQFFNGLGASFDVYEDLLGKSAKGLEFYKKLHGNVQKLMSRVKAARDVQDEERQQRIQAKVKQHMPSVPQPAVQPSMMPRQDFPAISTTGGRAKLKDYLNSGFSASKHQQMNENPTQVNYLPQVRPNPLGSESVIDSKSDLSMNIYANQGQIDYNKAYQPQMKQQFDQNYSQFQNFPQYSMPPQQYSSNNQVVAPQVPQYSAPNSVSSAQGYVNPMYQPPYYAQTGQMTYQTPPQQQITSSSVTDQTKNVYSGYNYGGNNQNYVQQFGQMNLSQGQTTPVSVGPSQISSGNVPGVNFNAGYGQNLHNFNQNQQFSTNTTPQAPIYGQNYGSTAVTNTTNSGFNQFSGYPGVSNPLTASQITQSYTAATISTTTAAQPAIVTSTPSNYSLTSHPTDPMYMGIQGVIKETGLNPSEMKPFEPQTSNTGIYQQNTATGGYANTSFSSYGNQYSSLSTNSMSTGMANTNPGGNTTDSKSSGVNGQSFVSQYDATPIQPTPPTNTGTLPYYTVQYGTHPDHSSSPSSHQTPSYYPQTNYANNYMTYMNSTDKSGTLTCTGQTQGPSMTSQEQNNQQQWQSTPPTNPIPTQNPQTASIPPQNPVPQATIPPVKSENFDLLSDIDFSINTSLAAPTIIPTLQPLPAKQDDQLSELSVKSASPAKQNSENISSGPISMTPIDRKASVDNISICSDVSSIDPNFDWESASLRNEEGAIIPGGKTADGVVSKYKDAFDDPKMLKWFHKEVERLEKFIETSNIKTLNGNTPLDGKWKELQDALVKDESKRVVNVARLFPEKNRSIDSIPYDHARVSLGTPTDDYINAGYVKFDKDKNVDLGAGFPTFILAQTPMPNTVNDFWSMIWTENLNTVVCLHPPPEILDVYWPQELNQTLTYGDYDVTLIKQFDLSHCFERSVKVSLHGQDKILYVSLLQIKAWIKNSANHILGIAQNIITSYKQQNQDKRQSSALAIHCLTGSDRSGLVTLAIAAILATSTKRPILINVVDVWFRICSQRKGALRDVSVLQESLQIVLNNGHSILNKRGIMTSYQMKTAQQQEAIEKEQATANDPFKDLDPLWKMKK
ncbi:LOW QUALITY PROTEIN: tyrosine-protein phosphatase non-receptor type 23 [Culicoides brevitarsis]|uniref:LOW QUALITY PROTEIN: tyrosine-protein phosphatase non-receptor type 23 n=1 Tax=Culicoides brevitarsis TaxID=469753 RepID=UPI00307BE74A